MPEGDTVYRAATVLHQALAGKELLNTDFRVPRFATTDLSGYELRRVYPRGKHLLMECVSPESAPGAPDAGRTALIHSHLKMDGSWRVFDGGPPRRLDHTVRAVLQVPGAAAVGYLLGVLEVLTPQEADAQFDSLGPDLLGPDWDAAEAHRRLSAEPDRPIGLALLDQGNLAGVGNVFRCEICFLVGIHPLAPVRQADLPRAVDLAYKLLQANKLRSTRSTLGTPAPRRDSTWVYGRNHKPCRKCGNLIRKGEELGRPLYFCPRCQPAPA